MALTLAVGFVVDDAIVVLENIVRHMEEGEEPYEAAVKGAKEIGFAVLATTIALVAVFVPLAFLTGNIGRLFNEFGVSVAVAVLISGFVALTLTPMLCSRMLKPLHHTGTSWASRSFDAFFDWMERTYNKIVRGALRHRILVMSVAVLLIVISAVLFKFLPSELVPTEDRGVGFGIVIAPGGATLEYTDRYMRQVEQIMLSRPETDGVFTAMA
jgi:multidrug efflux pump